MNNSKCKHKSMVDMRQSRQDSLQCFLCRNHSAHNLLLTCPSGHVYCDLCNQNENKETNHPLVLNYKNVKFNESRTSTVSKTESADATMVPLREDRSSILKKHNKNEEPKPVSRPVYCPVRECGKMIVINNVLLHFCYDHAKIPRLQNLNTTTREIVVKISEFIQKSRCYAVLLPTRNSNTLNENDISLKSIKNEHYQNSDSFSIFNNDPLLLMGATFSKSVRSISNQTDGCNKTTSASPKSTKEIYPGEAKLYEDCVKKKSSQIDLVLWMCKVSDNASCYSVTVISEDKRIGHSYIGQAIHIKEPQDASSIYERAECLIIHSGAVKKIINDHCQLHIIINILDE